MTDRTDEHRAKLAADPRFAAWAGGSPSDEQRTARFIAERNELTRIACQSHLEMAARGPTADPAYTRWCLDFVAVVPPLKGPLGTGDPVA